MAQFLAICFQLTGPAIFLTSMFSYMSVRKYQFFFPGLMTSRKQTSPCHCPAIDSAPPLRGYTGVDRDRNITNGKSIINDQGGGMFPVFGVRGPRNIYSESQSIKLTS